jgi:hypothetical protein
MECGYVGQSRERQWDWEEGAISRSIVEEKECELESQDRGHLELGGMGEGLSRMK